ncbi:hypothetical protein [Neobacillus sp. NPDC093127]|uniref:hypothetical protein n=1 Tax=Neobacillus sp. NPDC093127 TaxID=3364296 RepID=UPI003811AFC2
MKEEKLVDKRTSVTARLVWKSIRNNCNANDWINSSLIIENFRDHFSRQQIIKALNQLEKRGLIRKEQKGVRVINENYLIDLIKRIPQKNHVRLANIIVNYFIESPASDDSFPNELATAFLIEEQFKGSTPGEIFEQQLMLMIDNYRMETNQGRNL